MKNFIINLKKSYGSRSFKAGSYSIFAGLIVVAIAVAINLIMTTLPVSITQRDLSNEKLYTISQQTRQIVSGLREDVTIYWLVQPGAEDLTIEKLLDNYRDLSKHITVRHIDPVEQPNFAAKYTSEQIYNNTLIVDNGRRSKVLGYYDIYQYSGSYYSDSYDVSFAGESALTSALDYVTNSELPVAYCLSGHGEAALPDSLVKKIKDDNFILNNELSLLSLQALPEDCELLIINAAQTDISAEDKDKIMAYLQGGGKLLLVTGLFENGETQTNLEELMAYYGVSQAEGIVIEGDENYTVWNFNYYLLPDLDTISEITAPLAEGGYRVLVPVARGLNISPNLREGLEVRGLLTTSKSSFAKPEGWSISSYDKAEGDIDGPFELAVAVTEGETGIVIISSANMLDDGTNSTVSGANHDFFLNAMGWLSGEENSISIRAKSLREPTLVVTSGESTRMSLIIVVLLPLLLLGIGIFVFVRRKRR